MVLRPIPPQPMTRAESPGSSRPRCFTALYAVVTRQPTMLASSMDIPFGIRNAIYAGTDTYSAKPPTFQR